MARKGALSKKTFWPSSGDLLEDVSSGITWECARANTYINEKRGEKVRYGLLVADAPADSGITEMLLQAITNRDGSPWLESIEFIHRRVGTEETGWSFKKYTYNKDTETWQETE